MRKRLSLKSIEQLLWMNAVVYMAVLFEDYGLNAQDRIVANTWCLGLTVAVAGMLYLLRMWRERRIGAAG